MSLETRRIYLDHAATTPVHYHVIEVMVEALVHGWGNPSSLHTEGRAARKAKELAREHVAALLGTNPAQLYFTASGSESDQWAILGMAQIFKGKKNRIITSTIEHSAVRNTAKRLSNEGWDVQWLKPDKYGRYNANELQQLLNNDTAYVSLMYCNNELGTIQDIESLCNVSHDAGALFHTDAVQGLGKLPSPIAMGVDLVSIASHKINGPKGVGALWIKEGIDIPPWIAEASQERGKHAGTEGIPAIVGFGAACELWSKNKMVYNSRLFSLKTTFLLELRNFGCKYEIISPEEQCNNSIVNLRFPDTEAEALLLGFDLAGVAASAGSACASGAMKPSSVLLEIGLSEKAANECVRFSFGPVLTIEEIKEAAKRVAKVVERQRKVASGE